MSQNLYEVYKIINKTEFEALDLPSRKLTLELGTKGQKEILVTVGNKFSLIYEGIMLSLDLNDKNPFEFEDMSIFLDPNDDVWLGFKE